MLSSMTFSINDISGINLKRKFMATLIVALRVAIGYMMVSRTFNELHNLYEGEKVHDFAHASGCP